MRHAVGEPSLSCTLAGHTDIGLIALDHDSVVESVGGNGSTASPVRFVRLVVPFRCHASAVVREPSA